MFFSIYYHELDSKVINNNLQLWIPLYLICKANKFITDGILNLFSSYRYLTNPKNNPKMKRLPITISQKFTWATRVTEFCQKSAKIKPHHTSINNITNNTNQHKPSSFYIKPIMPLHEYLEQKRRDNIKQLNATGACHICGSTCRNSRGFNHFMDNNVEQQNNNTSNNATMGSGGNFHNEHSMVRPPNLAAMRTCACFGISPSDPDYWPYSVSCLCMYHVLLKIICGAPWTILYSQTLWILPPHTPHTHTNPFTYSYVSAIDASKMIRA